MAGPGIRYWEMARALELRGTQAVLLSRHVEKGFSPRGITFVGKASLANLVIWMARSDSVIQPGRPLAILLSLLFRKQLIFDQYDPVIFEFIERKPSTIAGKIHKSLMLLLWKIRQRIILRFGHRFLVANEKQKDFLIGQLTILGYTTKLDRITVLPFGLSVEKPVKRHPVLRGTKIKDTDFLLVWGGGIWDWFDPMSLLHAFVKIKQKRDDIKVYFPGLRPPNPDSRKMAAVDAFLKEAESLGLLGNSVIVNAEWTPYEQRADYLLEADAGISLHNDSLETRFAFRTRMLDYVWAGLPIIATKGDAWADLIERNGLGITVPPDDIDGIVRAIIKMADDTSFRMKSKEQVQTIANDYGWDALIVNLKL